MDNAKKLIIGKTPLNGYTDDAYQLSVALSEECSYEWLYSNYIQLIYQDPIRYDNQPVKFYKLSWKSGLLWDADCPLLSSDTIPHSVLKENEINIIDFICKSIYLNYYVLIYLDEFYLPYRKCYKKEHLVHDNLFYGYDYTKRKLYGLAYVTDEKGYHFKEFVVHMDIIEKAYFEMPITDSVQRSRVKLLSCNWEKYYRFDFQVVKNSVYEYINSTPTDLKYAAITNPNTKYVFGLKIYDELIKYYDCNPSDRSIIPLHIIYEHKKLMLDRIKYMVENCYIMVDDSLINEYNNIIEKAYLCKMLFLKYRYSETAKNHDKLFKLIYEVKNYDKILMEKLYFVIKESDLDKNENYIYSQWGSCKDQSYSLNKLLKNIVEIKFKLHIINNKSNGYIFFSDKEELNIYHMPMKLRIEAADKKFILENYESKWVVEDVKCMANNYYFIRIVIDIRSNKFLLEISDGSKNVKHENVFYSDRFLNINCINSMVAIHENSYRYRISELSYEEVNQFA